jgi:hypothetical protein
MWSTRNWLTSLQKASATMARSIGARVNRGPILTPLPTIPCRTLTHKLTCLAQTLSILARTWRTRIHLPMILAPLTTIALRTLKHNFAILIQSLAIVLAWIRLTWVTYNLRHFVPHLIGKLALVVKACSCHKLKVIYK